MKKRWVILLLLISSLTILQDVSRIHPSVAQGHLVVADISDPPITNAVSGSTMG